MNNTIKIGKNEYSNIWLAPMAGDGDKAFRLICKEHGVGYMCSEMVSAKALCYGDGKTPLLARISPEEAPMAIQLFGSDPEYMARGASIVLDNCIKYGIMPAAIDINMGCPVHKIVSNGEGSALMKNVTLISNIVSSVVKEISPMPVTVKTRLGWDNDSINVLDVSKAVEQAGASAICIHARTKAQLYSPGVNIDYIRKVKESIKIPVIGNGDIFSAKDAINMFEKTNCDAIAVARGALGNPWIFDEINAYIENKMFIPPTTKDRCLCALKQLEYSIEDKGEYTAIVESRKYISHYTKGIQGSSKIRMALNSANSVEEIRNLLERLCGQSL